MREAIRVRGARQHNLKGIDITIPRGALTVVTGPSGSGKSSLAFDTVYAEGQRRYIESLSTYAKQFLERVPKPAVDWIDGVSPSIAIEQKNTVQTSRSTVGTVTEAYDYMRLLWARIGQTVCPECGRPVKADTVQSALDRTLDLESGTRLQVVFVLRLSDRISHLVALTNLKAQGYLRVVADGQALHLEDLDEDVGDGPGFDLTSAAELLVVVDRLVVSDDDPELRERLADALGMAFAEGDGQALVIMADGERLAFSERHRCADCEIDFPEPAPLLFSFNNPAGACPVCNGFGANLAYDTDLIVPDPQRSLAEGALDPWSKPRYDDYREYLADFAAERGIDMHTPWRSLPAALRRELLNGSEDFEGVIPFLESRERKRYKQYIRVFLRQYQTAQTCDACGGTRLRTEALHVRVGGLDIAVAAAMPISQLRPWIETLELPPFEEKVSTTVRQELRERVEFLDDVGLGYLKLDRQARTLSGGEMQRIRLASCLGSHLVDALYVLDEPTIGLHPRDIERFLDVLCRLRDTGNTVLVVEHEPEVMAVADRIVELGPGSGERGGELVFEGGWPELRASGTTTGEAIRRRASEPGGSKRGGPRRSGPKRSGPTRRDRDRRWLHLEGARQHNIEDLDVDIPLGMLTVVTGVSGSGKSTLVDDILFHALERELRGVTSAKRHLGEPVGTYRRLRGATALDTVVLVDQSPIGRTPRSNPITYIQAFGEIRKLFAEQPLARQRDYGSGHFSFNIEGGRCPACKGAGEEIVEMVFMADVSLPCEVCEGRRFRPEVLEVEYRGLNVHDVLQLTVDEAIRFFIRRERLGEALWQLQRVGLGYLRLGQPATTLSGGEAQRLKIARELTRSSRKGRRFYCLDEPTVGLGLGEIETLVSVLRELVDAGNTVLVVEHNLDVISRADWIIDLGPEAAEDGGRIVAQGPPDTIVDVPESHTGRYLRRYLEGVSGEMAASG